MVVHGVSKTLVTHYKLNHQKFCSVALYGGVVLLWSKYWKMILQTFLERGWEVLQILLTICSNVTPNYCSQFTHKGKYLIAWRGGFLSRRSNYTASSDEKSGLYIWPNHRNEPPLFSCASFPCVQHLYRIPDLRGTKKLYYRPSG